MPSPKIIYTKMTKLWSEFSHHTLSASPKKVLPLTLQRIPYKTPESRANRGGWVEVEMTEEMSTKPRDLFLRSFFNSKIILVIEKYGTSQKWKKFKKHVQNQTSWLATQIQSMQRQSWFTEQILATDSYIGR